MFSQPQASENNVGLTALEYARLNGLSSNYLAEQPDFSHMKRILDAAHKNIADDARLPEFDFGAELSTAERLTVSKEAAILLMSVSNEETTDWIGTNVSSLVGWSDIKAVRVEQPLLRTDSDADCEDFLRKDGFEIHLMDVKLPMERVNDKNNEGVTWPSQYEQRSRQLTEKLCRERIVVPKSAVVYLNDVWRSTWTEEDERELRMTEIRYKKKGSLEPLTPPLSPRGFPTEPYEPSATSPGMEIPILSDPVSLVEEDLQALEANLFEEDAPTPFRKSKEDCRVDGTPGISDTKNMTVKLGDIYSPLASIDSPISSHGVRRVKYKNLKVEEPLTPPQPSGPLFKCVRFSNSNDEMLLDLVDLEDEDALKDNFFEEAFGDPADRADRKLQQETLQEVDSLSRVEVPALTFDLPQAPWEEFQSSMCNPTSLIATQRAFIKDTMGSNLSAWPGVKALLHVLCWVPFPDGLARIALNESIFEDDNAWETFVHVPDGNEIIDSSMLSWKPPGLKICHEREDEGEEEDLELGVFEKEAPKDLTCLVRNRRMDLACVEPGSESNQQAPAMGMKQALHNKRGVLMWKTAMNNQMPNSNHFGPARNILQPDNSNELNMNSLLSGVFSAGNSLDNYIELRGSKKRKLMDSNYFQINSVASVVEVSGPEQESHQQAVVPLSLPQPPPPKRVPLPVPSFDTPASPIHIIVSSTLLKHRALIKFLSAQLPTLNLVERDFTAHNTTTWLPGSISRSPIASPLAFEADLIVSAGTGLIMTTLQKVKQKPLPGQKTKAAIRERVEKTSARYEKLIVLVSEGRTEDVSSGLDENDCLALSEFIGFTLGLQATVTVQFVGGGVETLARWLASTIIQNGSDGDMTLLEEETHWELFLRRAGMSAFAAQLVIDTLKAPEGVETNSPTKAGQFGITAFVEMGRDRRIAMFGQTCGWRVLERVSAVVDGRWE